MRGRPSTLQVTVKLFFFFFSAGVKLIPSLEKKQRLAESQGSFQSGAGGKKRRKKKCDSKMSLTGSSPVLHTY